MRLVFDTNIIISAILFEGSKPSKAFSVCIKQGVKIKSSYYFVPFVVNNFRVSACPACPVAAQLNPILLLFNRRSSGRCYRGFPKNIIPGKTYFSHFLLSPG